MRPFGLTAAALQRVPGVAHSFFTRQGGVSSGLYDSMNTGIGSRDDRIAVLANRARAAAHLGVRPERLATPYQVHSADAVVVTEPWEAGKGPKADALVTDRPGIAIGIGTADCGPVLFADGSAGIVGAAHAGWKGAFTGVLEATIEAMEGLGAERGRIVATLGPMISADAYEVGPEFVARFVAADPENAAFFRPSERDGHAMFDLPGYIAARLRAAGIGTVDDLALCTYSDENRFFSYRRATHRNEPDYGRQLSAIALQEP
ncbi:peptidoglycan editing factor PgeF [Rhizobiales bacterium L72]|uniref:Purine nucleoside phosphorylase n=2 Tax=Propylenella binzhouense TaxID=2555902 RepID=A0A964T6L1_9HYPH|nr:peptidoglycan editing factor PgeF [Propylenella binzhouense]